MSKDKAGAGEKVAAGVGMGSPNVVQVPAPYYAMAVECVGPNGPKWKDGFDHNVVVSGGLTYLGNKVFGNQTATSNGPFLALHSASSSSDKAWANISASQVGGYSASMPTIAFATNAFSTALSASTSAAYAFTTSTYTVSGAAILFNTTNSLATNQTSDHIRMYAMGQFGASRQVQAADTLNVTVTVSLGTA